ncbi:MAG: signal peptide peptidase SppA [Myxococcota bacterium]
MKTRVHVGFVLLTCLFSVGGNAQVRTADVAERVLNPGPQIASGQDAWSLYNNPAGLAFVNGSELAGGYAHHWSNPDALHQAQFTATFSLFKGLSLGLGTQLQLPDNTSATDKGLVNGQLGLAYRFGRSVSMGGWAFKQRQYANESSDPFLFGFGVQHYPAPWISYGMLSRQVYDNFGSPAEFQVGLSLRPFGDDYTFFGEARFWPTKDSWSGSYHIDPIAGARIDLGGVTLIGQAVINSSPSFMFALDFNFEHFGMGAVAGNAYAGGRFRMSSEAKESVTVPSKKWVRLNINSKGTEDQKPDSLAAKLFAKPSSPLFFLNSLERLIADTSVEGVLVYLDSPDFGFARAEELKNSLMALKNSGKQVVVYLNNTSVVAYYVASAADKIYLNPGAEVKLDAFQTTLVYAKKGLDKLGVEAQAVHAGAYKSAPRVFTANEPGAEEVEVVNAILDERYQHFVEALAKKTGKAPTEMKAQIDLGELSSDEALTAGLVNALMSESDVPELKNQFRTLDKQAHVTTWGEQDKIAIIPIVGTIIAGHAAPSFFFPRVQTGADDVTQWIEHAVNDPFTQGILVRIDSPGGDAFASDQIFQALMKARQKKPVVASMGDIAASGGYYAAAAAQQIWAEPSTLTGSIGVFSLSFSAEKLLDKLGVSSFEFNRGKLPGPTLFRPLSAPERKRQEQLIEWRYTRFKQAIAQGQNRPVEDIAPLAEGRVWTGEQALANHLVHQLGGFSEALNQLKELAGLKKDSKVQLSLYQPQGLGLFNFGASPFASALDLIEHNGKAMALMPFIL